MVELGEATVNRILHEKTTNEEEKIKKLLNSRHSKEIIDFLKKQLKTTGGLSGDYYELIYMIYL